MSESKLSIPAPRRDRPPLKVNVFAAMQHANTQLVPLFPYLHRGAIVPGGATFRGGPTADYGHFFHQNTQDEVVLTFAAEGALLVTGQVFVGGRLHGVNSFLKKEKDPAGYSVMMITQLQAEAGPQTEAIAMNCEKCKEQVFIREFDATPPEHGTETEHPFVTLMYSATVLQEYNSSETLRTCAKCGHVNRPFPIAAWGWEQYATQSETVARGKADLMAASRPAAPVTATATAA